MPKNTILLFFLCCSVLLNAQQADSIWIEGIAFENEKPENVLNETIVKLDSSDLFGVSNRQGVFRMYVPKRESYPLRATKSGFKEKRANVPFVATSPNILAIKIPLERLPGYMLEVSITEFVSAVDSAGMAFAVDGATIEIYNNTLQREELRLVNHTRHTFSFLLQQGNEYIFMVRKKGYYTKRMRANVNVNNCILCLEGFGTVTPGVAEHLTNNNTMGTMIGNVSMKKLLVNETVKIDKIYYDVGSASLRPDILPLLNQFAEVLRDNPQIIIELSSHTDCRGSTHDNQVLSQKRAESVVNYLRERGKLEAHRVTAKGYGESKPVNSCVDGVDCTDELYQQNRRTEFTVTDILQNNANADRSLASIMQSENMDKILSANTEKYVDTEETPPTPIITKTSKTKQPPKVIPLQYSGYKIELLQDSQNPTLDHPVFNDFDEVFLDISPQNKFMFLVGDFRSRTEAERVAKQYQAKYPNAHAVEYQNGMRQ